MRAGSAADAWFGVGYAVAQDRLVELELFRRSTQGRLAEVLGASRLQSDIVARRDYYTRAELRRQIRRLPAPLRARFDAYAAGVNAWIARVAADPSLRPREFALLGLDAGAVDARSTRPRSACSSPAPCPRATAASSRTGARCATLGAKRFAKLLPLRRAGLAHRPCPPPRAASRPSPAAAAPTSGAASRPRGAS